MAVWSTALPMTASCLSPLPGFNPYRGMSEWRHWCALTWDQAVDFTHLRPSSNLKTDKWKFQIQVSTCSWAAAQAWSTNCKIADRLNAVPSPSRILVALRNYEQICEFYWTPKFVKNASANDMRYSRFSILFIYFISVSQAFWTIDT